MYGAELFLFSIPPFPPEIRFNGEQEAAAALPGFLASGTDCSLHTDSLHTDSLHTDSLHIDSLQSAHCHSPPCPVSGLWEGMADSVSGGQGGGCRELHSRYVEVWEVAVGSSTPGSWASGGEWGWSTGTGTGHPR